MEAAVLAPVETQEEPTSASFESDGGVRSFRWDADLYVKASEMGFFGTRKTELMDGEIIEMNAHSKAHLVGANKTHRTLLLALPLTYTITNQSTLYSSSQSRPEPDIAVFHGDWNDLLGDDPMRPVLIVEVSIDTLAYDRGRKAALYASIGVRDYWILNPRDNCLEVRREPGATVGNDGGWGYASTQILTRERSVAPLELPQIVIAVADLLP